MTHVRRLLASSPSPTDVVTAISHLLAKEETLYAFGSFTSSIYDTAWISMLKQRDDAAWLFPGSFDYVLRSQLEDGTWKTYASPVDGILNTLASLLALLVHRARPMPVGPAVFDQNLDDRVERACEGLELLLQAWDVGSTVHVGFEVLVPSLLLQIERHGIKFNFPGRPQLLDLHEAKSRKFRPEMVYGQQPLTLLHSLEALVGLIDFDKVRHHCSERLGIFGSPAATAAYLLYASSWDERAEAYLRSAISWSEHDAVPSAFPTCLFESSWAISTLLGHSVLVQDLDPRVVSSLASSYQRVLEEQAGVVGFAPGILEDADDTARVLLSLRRLGVKVDPSPLIATFQPSTTQEATSCFRTYQLEGNPSLSANANVLLALLSLEELDAHGSLIQQTAEFLVSTWEAGATTDKWNLSPCYSYMLLVDVFVTILQSREKGHLEQLPDSLVKSRIPISLCQILAKIMSRQSTDGSLAQSIEQTAYATISLGLALALPWDLDARNEMLDAHRRASGYISTANSGVDLPSDYIWVEKTTYGSTLLQKVYAMAAVATPVQELAWSEEIRSVFAASKVYKTRMLPMLLRLPLLTGASFPCIGLAMVEATRLTERLQSMRTTIFPRDELPMTKDDYLSYIPVFWTVCNQMQGLALSPYCLWEMIYTSLLNYQIDEYMETVVQGLPTTLLRNLVSHIRETCGLGRTELSVSQTHLAPMDDGFTPGGQINGSLTRQYLENGESKVAGVISAYVSHFMQHDTVVKTPLSDQHALAASLYDFLLSHITQNINSRAHYHGTDLTNGTGSADKRHTVAQNGFFDWVRSSASASTSGLFSFRFFTALLSPNTFPGARSHYFSHALAAHLATLCRMYNDCGSAARDLEEETLNSLDFAEFDRAGATDEQLQVKKDELLDLARFERGCIELAFKQLDASTAKPCIMESVRVFINVTDLFGQMYVQKDIASRMTKAKESERM